MKTKYFALYLIMGVLSASVSHSQTYTISTIAGNGVYAYSGDGGQATLAELYLPQGVVVDTAGNVYIADNYNERIRRVDPSGIIITIAGNGYGAPASGGFSGDGGPSGMAELYSPYGIALDDTGNGYIADQENNRIRKVNTNGIITTFAGNGYNAPSSGGYSGDGGAATSAELYFPTRIAFDRAGSAYITDEWNNVIRKVAPGGIISTVAGNYALGGGYNGDGIPATSAELYAPNGVSVDPVGNIYIADYANNRIRKVSSAGIISTYAGNGTSGFSGDGGAATSAEIAGPRDVLADGAGNIFIAEEQNSLIRMVNSSGTISTIAGNYIYGYGFSGDGGPATAAELANPWALAIDKVGNIFVADWNNQRVRELKTSIRTGTTSVTNNEEIKVYPNPTSGRTTIQISNNEQGIMNVEVCNVLGERVYFNSYQLSSNSQQLKTIDMSNEPNGIYFYRVLKADGTLVGSGKLMICGKN